MGSAEDDDLEELKLDPFLMISVIGQEYLHVGYTAQAITLLKLALEVDSKTECKSSELKLSVLGALSFAYYQEKNYTQATEYLRMQLDICRCSGKYRISALRG
ncbi:unnamed protein product [Gongylonema pulchrum]|uniref:Uncharacterized protein n=1 Tax=Gongylonema pulchrum TaxID=637853 RepID=A0A3P6TB52_9BILA|nr:unnamed protein product [Gongylonema pulchrum]